MKIAKFWNKLSPKVLGTTLIVSSLILITTLFSCNRSTPDDAMITGVMTSDQVTAFMTNVVPNAKAYSISDFSVDLTSEGWVKEKFSPNFIWFVQKTLGIPRRLPEIFDCEDFTRAGAVYAQVLHAKEIMKDETAMPMSGFAFGEFWYVTDKQIGHAINFAIVLDKKRNSKLLFFEPQNGQIVNLSTNEIAHCSLWRL